MNNLALDVRNLSVWYEDVTGRKKVVDNISLEIEQGASVGLAGESGCGKSATALAIMGLLSGPHATVQADRIAINGRDTTRMTAAQRREVNGRDIAMVFQQPGVALDPVFSIGSQIDAVVKRHTKLGRKDVRRATLDALGEAGFDHPGKIATTYPHQLSGGMQQLAMIAMATICKPAILIADEPTTALDNSTQALILKQFERLQREHKMAFLLISHDLGVIRQCCQNVMIMYCGRILEQADRDSFYTQPRHPYSAGLLACIPELSANRPAAIRPIPGQVPLASALPPGCHFAPRCDHVIASCHQSAPAFEVAPSGRVACFRPLS